MIDHGIKYRYKEGTVARRILDAFGEDEIKNLTSEVVSKTINCKRSTAKWAIKKIKDDLQIGCECKARAEREKNSKCGK